MTEQPKTVVCTSCNAKFHVPDELIRGKLVKFRCRKCGSAIDVDGRRSARPPAAPPPPPPEPTGVDTPATFSQRTIPPLRPPTVLTKSAPNLHPWPEPPRSARSTTAPIALPDGASGEESMPRLEAMRDPSNRAPKIAAIVALLIAAGLSGFGLAMRSAPVVEVAASGGEVQGAEAPHAGTKAADLAPATEGPPAATAAGAATSDGVNAAHPGVPSGVAGNAEPSPPIAAGAAQPATNAPVAAIPPGAPANGALAANDPASLPAANGAPSAPPASSPPSPAPVARSGKGDFNTQAAREAMEDAAGRAAKCRNIDTPSGTARVAVTFAPTGHVTNAVIESGPFVGTAAGTCVASKFRNTKVPPFSGDAVTVRKSVPF